MKWLLDTNVISDSVAQRPNRKVAEWIAQRSSAQIAISIVTVAELRVGAAATPHEARRKELLHWIETEVGERWGHTLPVTIEILVDWLRFGRKLAAERHAMRAADSLIAATARVHDLIVVSRNVRHFIGAGVFVYNPWTDETHRIEKA